MPDTPSIAVLCLAERCDARERARLRRELATQAGVRARLVALACGAPEASTAEVLRVPALGDGALLRAAAATLEEPFVALALPDARLLPGALARAAARLAAGASLVTADLLLADAAGRACDRTSPAAMGGTPGPFWEASLALRRELLGAVDPRASFPGLLALLRRSRAEGTAAHELEPAALVPRAAFQRAFDASVVDGGLVTLHAREPARRPELSVLVRARDRDDALETLRSLARQLVRPGRFEVLLLERERGGAAAELPLALPVPLRRVRGAGAGWEAGLELARAPLVLLLDAGVTAAPELVGEHLRAHARAGRPVLVRGVHAPAAGPAASALERLVRADRGAAGAAPCNASAPLAALLAARARGALDGPRLADALAELPARDAPLARSLERPCRTLDELERRCALRAADATPGRAPAAHDAREDALRELAALDVEALAELGGDYAALAERVERRVAERLPAWLAGRASGDARRPSRTRAPRVRPRAPGEAPPAVPSRARAPELSVVVPTRDRPRELRGLVEALLAQELEPERFELLVADDGSELPAARALEGLKTPFALRALRLEPGGPARARNRVLGLARGASVLLLNDDAVPAPDLLARHLRRQGMLERPTALLGSFALVAARRGDSLATHVETSSTLFAWPCMKPGVLYHGLSLCSGNLSLPRAVLERAGGFDEGFPLPGGEDCELGLRLEREQGVRVLFDPSLACGHDHALALRALLARKRTIGWSLARIQARHEGLELLPAPWPPAPAERAAFERAIEEERAALEPLAVELEAAFARERAQGREEPRVLALVRERLPALERLEVLRGALAAARGAPGPEPAAGPPVLAPAPALPAARTARDPARTRA